ncbi:MAG: histidinol-phosphate transaminase, partial [Microcystaceae cyanobacterium]
PPSSLMDFSASLKPLAPPLWVKSEIQSSLESLTAYPSPDYGSLRAALGQWHQLSPDWILPGNGAAELLTWAAWELSQCPVTYLLTPAFGDYQRALRTFGAKVHLCPLHYSPESLICDGDTLFSQGQDGGVIINHPHNPTGKKFSTAQLLKILERFSLVVVDEAFMDFLPPQEQSSLIEEIENYPNLVILRSLTKFYRIPGLRLGYAISHPERLNQWQALRDPWPVNSVAMQIGEKVPQDSAFAQQTWDWLVPTREELYQGLASLVGLTPYQGVANFLLVETQCSAVALQERLLKDYQILIRDCLSFPELSDRFFRIAVRTATDNQYLLRALDNILAVPDPS